MFNQFVFVKFHLCGGFTDCVTVVTFDPIPRKKI